MARRPRSLFAALLVAGALAAPACATQPVAEEVRATFGSVAIVAADVPSRIDLSHPTAGSVAGLGMGFARGVSAIVVWPVMALGSGGGGMSGDPGVAGIVILGILILVPVAAAVVWLPCSVAGGAITAIPVDDAEAAETVLVAVARDYADSRKLAEAVARKAQRAGGRGFAPEESADTLVEIGLAEIARGRSWNWWTFDRPFPVGTEAHVRVLRRADRAVLWEATFEAGPEASQPRHTSSADVEARSHKYLEWAADGGAALRAELESQVEFLAHTSVAYVFGPARGATPAPAEPAPPAPAAR